jgi:hypothetical protein
MTKVLSNETDMFYEIIWLDNKVIKVTWYEKTEKKHILTVKGRLKTCECPICHKKTKKRDWLYEVTMVPLWKHLLISDGNMVELRIIRRSFRCDCKARFMERFYFEAEKGERTKAFEDFVRFSRWHMSWAQIARNTQCDPWLTHNILSWIWILRCLPRSLPEGQHPLLTITKNIYRSCFSFFYMRWQITDT